MNPYDDNFVSSPKEKRLSLLVWFYLSRFFNKSNRLSSQHLKEWGLSISQFEVLAQVGSNHRITQKELSERLLVTKGNIAQIVAKLEKLELIQHEREWKTKYLSLTKKGQLLYNDVIPEQEAFQTSQFSNLDRDEQQQLLSLLKKLYKGTN